MRNDVFRLIQIEIGNGMFRRIIFAMTQRTTRDCSELELIVKRDLSRAILKILYKGTHVYKQTF